MDRVRLGLLVLLAGALAWLAYALVGGLSDSLLDLGVLAAGAALAAWAAGAGRPALAGAGLLVVAAATVLFYDGDLGSGLASAAGAVFGVGAATAGVAWLATRPRAVAVGAFVACAGAVLWVVADGFASLGWQPGNVLAAVGMGLVGVGARDGLTQATGSPPGRP